MSAAVVSIQVAVWSILSNHQGVFAMTDGRIYRRDAEQETKMPFILIHQTGGAFNYTLSGSNNLRSANIRLEMFAEDLDDLDRMEAEVRDALDAYRGTIEDVRIDGAFGTSVFDDSDLTLSGSDERVSRRFMDWDIVFSKG